MNKRTKNLLLWFWLIWSAFGIIATIIYFAYGLDTDKICSTFNFTYSECDEFINYLIANDTIIENHTYVINNTVVQNHTYVINRTIYTTINNTINQTEVIKVVLNNTVVKYINNSLPQASTSQNFYEQLFQTLLLQTLKEKFGLSENDNVDIKKLQQQINELKNSSQQIDYNKISQLIREQLSYVQPQQQNNSFDYNTLIMMFIAAIFGIFAGYQYLYRKNKQEWQEEIKEEYEYPQKKIMVSENEEDRNKNKRRDVI